MPILKRRRIRKNNKQKFKDVIFQCVSPEGKGTGPPKGWIGWAAINWGGIDWICGGWCLTNAGAPLCECALPLKLLLKFQFWFPCSWLRLPPWLWWWWWWLPFWFLWESRGEKLSLPPPWVCDAEPFLWFWPLGEGLCEGVSTSGPCGDGWELEPLAADPEALLFRLNDLWREVFGVGLGFARPPCFGAGTEAFAFP